MADDITPADEPATDSGDQSDDTLGDAGKKALDAERKARREAEQRLKDVEAQLKELSDKDKSEVEKLREAVTALTKERDDSAAKVLRFEVASEKGLTPAQAKRLVGVTKEELEADADEILEAFPASSSGATPPPSRRPAADLKGGSDPTEEPVETDPRKLAESVPPY